MKRERSKYAKKPTRLLTLETYQPTKYMSQGASGELKLDLKGSKDMNDNRDSKKNETILDTDIASSPKPMANTSSASNSISFADRYEAEIAPPSRMQEYQTLANKHKAELLKETTSLKTQFSSQMEETRAMESNVESISHMLTEFIHIVDSQSNAVVDIYEMAKDATENVKKTDLELETTIGRTESYQQSMVSCT